MRPIHSTKILPLMNCPPKKQQLQFSDSVKITQLRRKFSSALKHYSLRGRKGSCSDLCPQNSDLSPPNLRRGTEPTLTQDDCSSHGWGCGRTEWSWNQKKSIYIASRRRSTLLKSLPMRGICADYNISRIFLAVYFLRCACAENSVLRFSLFKHFLN